MPILTLLFRHYFSSIPEEPSQGRPRRWRGFWAYLRIMLPMSLPIFVVALILQVTRIWKTFLLGVVSPSPTLPDDRQLINIVDWCRGQGVQRRHGRDALPTGLRAADHLFRLWQAVRPRHCRRCGKGLNAHGTSISVKDLTLNFGSAVGAEESDLDVSRASHRSLGPSGCGKSTLLNCCGLLDISDGQVRSAAATSPGPSLRSAASEWCSSPMRFIRR